MAHQVFVSYATEDADTASRVCALLEADGIRCWVAPRDVKAGTDYAAAIMDAIRNSQLVVLIFSTHSNVSPYALREIERSVAYGRPVLALRTDDTDPNPSMEYYLHEWIEAPEGVESKRKEIISAVRQQLARPSAAATSAGRGAVFAPRPPMPVQPGARKAAAKARPWYRRTWGIALAAVLVVVAVGLGLGLGLNRGHGAPPGGTMGNHIAWTELKPSGTLPSARAGHSMAYDPTSGRLIVFGGSTDKPSVNETWAYDPVANTWTELILLGALPTARSGQSMAYDPATYRLIVFGGSDDSGAPLSDTWSYDSAAKAWTELKSAAAPPARAWHTMVYDPATHRLIIFGGRGNSGAPLNDTWAYDPAANTWTELKPSGALPPARSAHAMAYDPVTRRLIIFGGRDDAGGTLDDAWAYDPAANTWTELKPSGTVPTARSAHSMAYDRTGGRLIMFGGQDSVGTTLDDAWVYDSLGNTWTELEPSGTQPRARAGHVIVYDDAGGRLVMFGGYSTGFGNCNEIWTCAPG